MSREIGIRELKNRTSAVIERVEAGESVTITRRGKPVAHVIPAGVSPGMAKLIAEGRVRWSGRRPRLPTAIALHGEGPEASDIVSEGRGPR